MSADVVQLPVSDLRDIPKLLRGLADRIEANEDGPWRFVVVAAVRKDDSQVELAFGDVSMHEAVGAFAWAASHMGA